ncbi:hypothetical protein HDU83_009117, partial [Entophlyctis luteolus]
MSQTAAPSVSAPADTSMQLPPPAQTLPPSGAQGSAGPLLICLDETPRALQTLRFAIDNFVHSMEEEEICVVFCLPPTTSTLVKNTVTARIRSFLALATEKYGTPGQRRPNIKLYVLDRTDILDAVADLCVQVRARMLVMGSCADVSFVPRDDVDSRLKAGTGARENAYYATAFRPLSPAESPVLLGGVLSEKISKGSLGSGRSSGGGNERHEHHNHTFLETVGDMWHALTHPHGAGHEHSGAGAAYGHHRHPHHAGDEHALGLGHHLHATSDGVVVQGVGVQVEQKSAYVVEGAFAKGIKERAPVPVVV